MINTRGTNINFWLADLKFVIERVVLDARDLLIRRIYKNQF